MSVTIADGNLQDVLLLAARAEPRLLPDHHVLARLAAKLMERREQRWIAAAIDEDRCPSCLLALGACPDCPDGEQEAYCGPCDTHWQTALHDDDPTADRRRAPAGGGHRQLDDAERARLLRRAIDLLSKPTEGRDT
jgi:hypothetical protein